MHHLTAIIHKPLTEDGIIGIRPSLMQGTIFYQGVRGGVTYRITKHLKTDGYAISYHTIERCDNAPLSVFDTELLTKGKKIKTLYVPGGKINPGYDL